MGGGDTPSGVGGAWTLVDGTLGRPGPGAGELTALVGREGAFILADAIWTEGVLDGVGCGDALLLLRSSKGMFSRTDGALTGEEATPSGMKGFSILVDAIREGSPGVGELIFGARVMGPGVGELIIVIGFTGAFGAAWTGACRVGGEATPSGTREASTFVGAIRVGRPGVGEELTFGGLGGRVRVAFGGTAGCSKGSVI